jgi:L-ascorbate metabolism protein UlaG (beta-lactamase superfamily)
VPTVREVLGCDRNRRLHGHDRRYDKPIDIVFVCHEHHEHLHHRGPLELKPGGRRKWARAPDTSVRCH